MTHLLQVAADDFHQLVSPFGAFLLVLDRRVCHMFADVVLDDLGHQAVHAATCCSKQMQNVRAAMPRVEGALDGF